LLLRACRNLRNKIQRKLIKIKRCKAKRPCERETRK
jgi:hypothetical protein